MDRRVWCLVAVAAALSASAALACNSSSNDPVSACTGYCEHVVGCEGFSGSTVNSACAQQCAEAGAVAIPCGDGGAPATKFYNCLEGLPCSDFTGDAGTSALMNCYTQSCQ